MVTGVSAAIVSILVDNSSGDCLTQTDAVVRGKSITGVGSGVCVGAGVDVIVGASVNVAEGVGVSVSGVGLGAIVVVADGVGVNVWVAVELGIIVVVAGGAEVGVLPNAIGRRATVNCR